MPITDFTVDEALNMASRGRNVTPKFFTIDNNVSGNNVILAAGVAGRTLCVMSLTITVGGAGTPAIKFKGGGTGGGADGTHLVTLNVAAGLPLHMEAASDKFPLFRTGASENLCVNVGTAQPFACFGTYFEVF